MFQVLVSPVLFAVPPEHQDWTWFRVQTLGFSLVQFSLAYTTYRASRLVVILGLRFTSVQSSLAYNTCRVYTVYQ
jgi:hypothetical protein